MKIIINTQIPEFKLEAYADGKFINISDKDLHGRWNILFFYPADFTFVCPTELVDMAEHYDEFKALNAEVLAVSTDSQFTHKAWHDSSESIAKVKFPMLADKTGYLSDALGALDDNSFMAYRATVIVDPEGHVKAFEINDNGIGRNSDEILRKLQAAQFVAEHGDQVCPARWRPGSSTLTPAIELVGKI